MMWLTRRMYATTPRWRSAALLMMVLTVGLYWRVASAQQSPAIQLGLPLACMPGIDCFVMNYVDHDDGPGRRDYQCRHMTYNEHRGTDFALADPTAMTRGVPVLAAAPGEVVAVRDDMADIHMGEGGAKAIEGRECGNRVVIDHGGGWVTNYCHLRRGSVAVRLGQRVRRGHRLGLVGLSGGTEFPHVHLGVTWRGRPIDPFVGLVEDIHTSCSLGDQPLWSKAVAEMLKYQPVSIYRAGFVDSQPKLDDIRQFKVPILSAIRRDASVLSIHYLIVGIAKRDRVVVRLRDPSGQTIAERIFESAADKILMVNYFGKKRGQELWLPGTYSGEIEVVLGPGSGDGTISHIVSVELR